MQKTSSNWSMFWTFCTKFCSTFGTFCASIIILPRATSLAHNDENATFKNAVRNWVKSWFYWNNLNSKYSFVVTSLWRNAFIYMLKLIIVNNFSKFFHYFKWQLLTTLVWGNDVYKETCISRVHTLREVALDTQHLLQNFRKRLGSKKVIAVDN